MSARALPPRVLVVFAKAPRPGLVKTRMCPPLEPEEAAEFYACMLDDVLEASVEHAAALHLDLVLAAHPDDAVPELTDRAPPAFRVIAQRGDGLARRLDHAVREACAGGYERVIVRGSDNPMVDADHLRITLDLLDRHDLVLTPDRDGGYGAIGVRSPIPGIFDHAMSSEQLLSDTIDGARALGLEVALGPESFDIDSIDDVALFGDGFSSSANARGCARTLAWIDARGLRGGSP